MARSTSPVATIEQGNDLHISDNLLTVGEFVWAVKPDLPIKSLKDFKGRKIDYTNPRSTSQGQTIFRQQSRRFERYYRRFEIVTTWEFYPRDHSLHLFCGQ
jgi:hypothetical protein